MVVIANNHNKTIFCFFFSIILILIRLCGGDGSTCFPFNVAGCAVEKFVPRNTHQIFFNGRGKEIIIMISKKAKKYIYLAKMKWIFSDGGVILVT